MVPYLIQDKVAPGEHIMGKHKSVIISIKALLLRVIFFVEFMEVERHSL